MMLHLENVRLAWIWAVAHWNFSPNYVSNLCMYYQTQDCSPAVKGQIYPQYNLKMSD